MTSITKDKALIGAAGVHFVVSELSLRGLVALPTIRNTQGIDVVVVGRDKSWHANLQVKCSRNKVKFWPVQSAYRDFLGSNNFFVFVRYLDKEERFEAFLVAADEVIQQVDRAEAQGPKEGIKKWAPCFSLPKDDAAVETLKRHWLNFGVDRGYEQPCKPSPHRLEWVK